MFEGKKIVTVLKQICNEYLIKFSENQSAPKLENRKTSPCAPNLLHVLVSRILGYHNLCSPGHKVNKTRPIKRWWKKRAKNHYNHQWLDPAPTTYVNFMRMIDKKYIALYTTGLHKLWYPGIRDTSTWGKFGAHGEHGDVFLFSNLGALWFSENLFRYSLHVCFKREVKNNLFSLKGKSKTIFFP